MRAFAIMAGLAFALAIGGTASAQSKCDAGITKAAGKKVFCKAKVNSKAQKNGTTPDAAKLTKCEDKFTKDCNKAQGQGDCQTQLQPCPLIEAEVDTCVAAISSPSGAFVD